MYPQSGPMPGPASSSPPRIVRDHIDNADYIIDIGPEAGFLGGELVFAGDFQALEKQIPSLQIILPEDWPSKYPNTDVHPKTDSYKRSIDS